ncbi:MAG: CcdB family protein [Spirochaeta sp.]|jgi:toxin CcdB|nr:CcdB family protein [Spirochaeta sp.]
MAQFEIYLNGDERTRERTPYLLDMQADLLSDLATRIVAPLRPGTEKEQWVVSRMHPVLRVGEEPFVAVVSEMAAVPASILGGRVGDARERRTELIAAVDLLITGF